MKKILLSMFLLGTLISVNAQVPSYVPSNGLVGWWPFSGNANDNSGNANNGTVNGATLTNDRYGNSNSAYMFDGVNDDIVVQSNNSLNLSNQFTITAWIAPDTNSSSLPSPNILHLIMKGNQNYSLKTAIPNRFSFGKQNSQDITMTPSNTYIKSNWIQVTIVFNYPSADVYLNGVLSSNGTANSTFTANNSNLTFGSYVSQTFSKTRMDDIGIWNRALTSSEIKDLYNGCKLSISTEPTSKSSSINGQVQFNTLANDTTSSYLWQSNPSNVGWVNLPSNSVYSGVATKRLKVSNVQVNNHKQLFRVIASKNTCKDTSVVAMLSVNDTCITSTTDTLYIKVNTSSLSNPVYNTVKVYPNPSSTQVIIDNGNYNTMGSYTAKIVNTAGQQVFQSVINQQQFVIDAKTMGGAGVYTLYITDANNKVVGVKKIVLQ